MTALDAVEILGIPVDPLGAPEALAELREAIASGRRVHVVTLNNEMVMRAQDDDRFRRAVQSADLRLPDSTGIVWAAHYLKRPPGSALGRVWRAVHTLGTLLVAPRRVRTVVPEAVPGSDLVIELAGMGEEFGFKLFLLGAAPGVADRAAEELRHRFPQLEVCGTHDGGSGQPAEDKELRRAINAARPDILLVAYRSPKQEVWINRNLGHLKSPLVAVGVGGTFDYLAGASAIEGGRPAKQPPAWVRQRGLEWLWRLGTQPHRLGRVITAFPKFVFRVVKSAR